MRLSRRPPVSLSLQMTTSGPKPSISAIYDGLAKPLNQSYRSSTRPKPGIESQAIGSGRAELAVAPTD